MQLSGTKYACTRSTFATHMLSVEERLVWYNSKRRHHVIYPFGDFKSKTLFLFGYFVFLVEYNGRNLIEKLWEEIL